MGLSHGVDRDQNGPSADRGEAGRGGARSDDYQGMIAKTAKGLGDM